MHSSVHVIYLRKSHLTFQEGLSGLPQCHLKSKENLTGCAQNGVSYKATTNSILFQSSVRLLQKPHFLALTENGADKTFY